MYLTPEALQALTAALHSRFHRVALPMDCYTVLAARMSVYKIPIRTVGVTQVYGLEKPELLEHSGFSFVGAHDLTPQPLEDMLSPVERWIFRNLYGGKLSHKLYRLYEYYGTRAGTA